MYRTNLQKNIVIPSLIIIASVALGCIMVPEGAKAVLTFLKQELFNSFSWIYILSVAFFFLFLVVLCLLPNMDTVDDFEPVCYFADGRRGYSLKYMRREELLTDVLRQYERYIRMIANSKHNLYLFDKKNDET